MSEGSTRNSKCERITSTASRVSSDSLIEPSSAESMLIGDIGGVYGSIGRTCATASEPVKEWQRLARKRRCLIALSGKSAAHSAKLFATMPSVPAYRKAFDVRKGSKIGEFTVTKSTIGHEVMTPYVRYEFPTTLVLQPSSDTLSAKGSPLSFLYSIIAIIFLEGCLFVG